MHSTFRKRGVILAGLLAMALAAVTPAVATAKPEPGAKGKGGFRLFARSLGAMTVNRVYLGLNSDGEVGVDSTNSSTIGGGFWPKGTPDQYIFNSGLQIAGVISNPGGAWDNDTTGAFFFDPKGTTQHGVEVEPIYNTTNPDDFAAIRDAAPGSDIAAGRVPGGTDANASLYVPLLQDRVQASQGDVWFMSWDGNPSLNAGRKHPLGVVVETRGMGWNYPTGNEDITYFTYTFYNVTTLDPAAYVNIRPEMKSILLQKAQEFQASNNAAFGVSLPHDGYTITNMYAAFATDMDVATSGQNWSSVNLPFAMGYTYADKMAPASGWTFDAATFSGAFFPGVGFAGIKYLKSPTGPGAIQLFSNTINGSPFSGAFNDPQNTTQLWRYLSANISIPAGDQPCNMGLPSATHICWVNNTQPADMRFFQSSTGLTLPPGGQGTIVVAYIFAAPVKIGSCNAAPCPVIKPGTAPYLLGDPSAPNNGATAIDSLTGYRGCSDLNTSGFCEQTNTLGQNEWNVVPGSLLGKAYTAQAVFDAKFLLPFAPDAPQFFLIPGDNQVTVMWQASPSEVSGDPYYFVASNVNSPLYDPNYRLMDVEGYRIYRGRVDNADELNLVAQFDYKGTVFKDYDGIVNSVNTCAPNIPVPAVGSTGCPVAYSKPWTVGVPRTVAHDNPLVGTITQVQPANRLLLATGLVFDTDVDTVITGKDSGLPGLEDTGVPFVYVDTDVRNNFRYFYVVTAFDVNSIVSGPTSLESGKSGTIAVVPQALATNYANSHSLTPSMVGRGLALNPGAPIPTIDPATGTFSGPQPPANAWTFGFQDFVQQVIAAPGSFEIRLDSISLGSSYSSPAVPTLYHFSAISGADTSLVLMSILQDPTQLTVSAALQFNAVQIDSALAAIYGGSSAYYLKGQLAMQLVGTYFTGGYGRGCTNSATGAYDEFGDSRLCSYNGPRWFAGPSPQNNETMSNPNFGNPAVFTTEKMDNSLPNSTGYNNAGELPGVLVIHAPSGYITQQTTWRNIEGVGSGAARGADYNVYWGAGGLVDSVIDVTHNVPVPFDANLYRGGWGFLNASAANNTLSFDARVQLTIADVGCVEPYRSRQGVGGAGGIILCGGPAYPLSQTAVPGPTVFADSVVGNTKTFPVATFPGFIMLLGGKIIQFELADAAGTLPAAGTVWTMRDYVGAITGGNGYGGDEGPYAYNGVPRPLTAPGVGLRVDYDVVNQVNTVTNQNLEAVHTIPDPYYVTNAYENTYDNHVIKFVNLPTQATIRIYSSSGVLVRTLQYSSPELGGALDWNVKNRNNQVVASGVYFYQIESGDARRIGRMTIVTFAK